MPIGILWTLKMLVHDMWKNSVLLEWRFAETEAAGLEDISQWTL
jgi:hypothetical protein